MKEPHAEGVATHGGPESCGGPRERSVEALTGARVGWAIEPRNQDSLDAHGVDMSEGNMAAGDSASLLLARRGRRPHACSEPLCARTGRSTGRPRRMVPRAASERPEAAPR